MRPARAGDVVTARVAVDDNCASWAATALLDAKLDERLVSFVAVLESGGAPGVDGAAVLCLDLEGLLRRVFFDGRIVEKVATARAGATHEQATLLKREVYVALRARLAGAVALAGRYDRHHVVPCEVVTRAHYARVGTGVEKRTGSRLQAHDRKFSAVGPPDICEERLWQHVEPNVVLEQSEGWRATFVGPFAGRARENGDFL